MGVEIQNKIINKMLTKTANDMRLIAAKLIPYMMMKGNTADICHFNDFTDDIAGLIESHVSKDNKEHFVAPTILDEHIDAFLFNLAICLCRSYSDVCDNCPDQETCLRTTSRPTASPHIVPMSQNTEPKKPKAQDDDTDEFL